MNKIRAKFFVFVCWLAAKAITMRARQMIKEGVFIDANLPLKQYCDEIFNVDFGEVVFEYIEKK